VQHNQTYNQDVRERPKDKNKKLHQLSWAKQSSQTKKTGLCPKPAVVEANARGILFVPMELIIMHAHVVN
jgi:hypothetical protein